MLGIMIIIIIIIIKLFISHWHATILQKVLLLRIMIIILIYFAAHNYKVQCGMAACHSSSKNGANNFISPLAQFTRTRLKNIHACMPERLLVVSKLLM